MKRGRKPGQTGKRGETREKVYDYVKFYITLHGYAPTLREIAAALELSGANNIPIHLRKLDEEGKLSYTPRIARGIALTRFG